MGKAGEKPEASLEITLGMNSMGLSVQGTAHSVKLGYGLLILRKDSLHPPVQLYST